MTDIETIRRIVADRRAEHALERKINLNCLYIGLLAAAFTVFAIVFGIRP